MTMAEGSGEISEPPGQSFTVSSAQTPSTAVVISVADHLGVDVTEMPPLREAVEPDALNDIFVDGDADLSVDFEYAGCSVTVEDGTLVRVTRSVGPE